MNLCGLLGNKISYSCSPDIHNEYYKKNHIPLKYSIFDVEEKDLDYFIKNLRKNNIIGLNVTIPYKETILKYIDTLDSNARKIGAVNTVLVEKNALIGYNTDYYGFIDSLREHNYAIKDGRFLIIGSGGVAKAVYFALLDQKAKIVDIASRNTNKSKSMFCKASKCVDIFEIKNYNEYDIIINCTPIGGSNYLNETPIKLTECNKNTLVYDLNYIPKKTLLLKTAEKLGYDILNGESMLKSQAYSAINIWLTNSNRR